MTDARYMGNLRHQPRTCATRMHMMGPGSKTTYMLGRVVLPTNPKEWAIKEAPRPSILSYGKISNWSCPCPKTYKV